MLQIVYQVGNRIYLLQPGDAHSIDRHALLLDIPVEWAKREKYDKYSVWSEKLCGASRDPDLVKAEQRTFEYYVPVLPQESTHSSTPKHSQEYNFRFQHVRLKLYS
jgi:hypothetical protein